MSPDTIYRLETANPLAGRHEQHTLEIWRRVYGYVPDYLSSLGGKFVAVEPAHTQQVATLDLAKRKCASIATARVERARAILRHKAELEMIDRLIGEDFIELQNALLALPVPPSLLTGEASTVEVG